MMRFANTISRCKSFLFSICFAYKSSGELVNTQVDGCYLDTQILPFVQIWVFNYLCDFSLIWKYYFTSHPILLLHLADSSFLATSAPWLGCSPCSTNSANLGCFGVKKGKVKQSQWIVLLLRIILLQGVKQLPNSHTYSVISFKDQYHKSCLYFKRIITSGKLYLFQDFLGSV